MIRSQHHIGGAPLNSAYQFRKPRSRRAAGQQLFMLAAALLVFVIVIFVDHMWTATTRAWPPRPKRWKPRQAEKE